MMNRNNNEDDEERVNMGRRKKATLDPEMTEFVKKTAEGYVRGPCRIKEERLANRARRFSSPRISLPGFIVELSRNYPEILRILGKL